MRRYELTQSELKECLHYNPETGVFTWRNALSSNMKAGRVAGSINGNGHRQISIKKTLYYASRLAYLYMTGEWPPVLMDHKNRIKSDDRWKNLRPATRLENNQNRSMDRRNTSGFSGVSECKDGRWYAYIRVSGKMKNLGKHIRLEDAIAARKAAEIKHYGEFAPL